MNIGVFYRNLNQGGVQRMMVNFANYMQSHGFKITLILINNEGEFLKLLDDSIDVVPLSAKGKLFYTYRLKKIVEEKNLSALFTATPSLNIMAIIAKVMSSKKIKLIISERSNTIEEFKNNKLSFYKLSFFLIPFLYRFSDQLVAVSKGVAVDLAKVALLNLDRINVIYNPVFNEELLKNSLLKVDHEWFSDKNCKVIVGVGRLMPQKNFDLLIDAVKELSNNNHIKLIIVGDGAMKGYLKDKIDRLDLKDVVDIVGFKLNPIAWINKANLFVLSSSWEGFGNILVEALAAGTTILSTDCKSGPSEILEDGKYGYLIPPNDLQKMIEGIKYALDNPMDPEFLIDRARQFNLSQTMKQYNNLLTEKS